MNPGAVATDLCGFYSLDFPRTLFDQFKLVAADASGQDEGMKGFLEKVTLMSVEDCVAGLLHEIDNASRENWGGQFVNFDGVRRKW